MKKIFATTAAILLSGLLPAVTHAQYTGGISRADFVQMVMQRKGIYATNTSRCFTDVTTQQFAPAVCTAKQYGYVTGGSSGKFRPNDRITFVEAAAIMVRAQGVRVANDAIWYRPYLHQIAEWEAYPDSVRNFFDVLTYNQALELMDNVLDHDDDDDDDDNDDNDDLSLSISASDDSPEPGDRITFRIRLTNDDNDDLNNVEVSAELDDNMEYVSSSDDGDEDDGTVEWEDIDIDEDETKTLLLTVEIDDDADDGDKLRLRVEAEGERKTKTIELSDDDDDDDDGDIELSITDSPDPVDAGDTIMYRITLRNRDNDRAYVNVRAEMDEDTSFVSVGDNGRRSGDTVYWDNLFLNGYETRTVTLWVRAENNVDDGETLELRVEAGDEEDTEETDIEGDDDDDDDDEDVRISISDSPDPAWRGDSLQYRITIENNENHDITVDPRAILDRNTYYLSSSHNGDLDSDQVEWDNIRINRNDDVTLLLTVRVSHSVNEDDTLRLRIEAGSDEETEVTEVR